MKRAALILLMLVFSISIFGGAREELLALEKKVAESLETNAAYKAADKDESSTEKRSCSGVTNIVLFDPNRIHEDYKSREISLEQLYILISNGEYAYKFGGYKVYKEIYSPDDADTLFFGLLVLSQSELQMKIKLNLSGLKIRKALLHDFIDNWCDNGGDLIDYLIIKPDEIQDKYLKVAEVSGDYITLRLRYEDSLWKAKSLHLWVYIFWVEFDVNKDTPSGVYRGCYLIQVEPLFNM